MKFLHSVIISLILLLSATTVHSATYYFHNDHLGTPQVLTDENQAVVWKGAYDPFGQVTETVATVEQNLRFPGQYLDRESGLHYNYFRTYDPNTGRYTQSDPIGLGGGINTYGYVSGNPLKYIDPNGLDVIVVYQGGQGPNVFGHVGVGVTVGPNANNTFGAGPNEGVGIGLGKEVAGHVAQDTNKPIKTVRIPTTPEQDAAVMAYNAAAVANDFSYGVTSNSCVDHTRGALSAAGITIPGRGDLTNFPWVFTNFVSQIPGAVTTKH